MLNSCFCVCFQCLIQSYLEEEGVRGILCSRQLLKQFKIEPQVLQLNFRLLPVNIQVIQTMYSCAHDMI